MDETTEWLRVPAAEPRGHTGKAAEAHQVNAAKSLGVPARLAEIAVRLATLQGRERPSLDAVTVAVFAADNEFVIEESSRSAATAGLIRAIARGEAPIGLHAREIAARLEVINLGTATDPGPLAGVLDLRIEPGPADFRSAPAMTRHQLARAIHAGRHAAERARLGGAQLFIGGTVGSGTAVSATALACALRARPPERLIGADAQGTDQELESIQRGLARHREHLDRPLEALRRLGGFGLAALTGSYMACSHMGLPVLVDGFASSVAALMAVRLCAGAERWLLYAQGPRQRRHRNVLNALGARPPLGSGACLGDGAGGISAVPLLRLVCVPHGKTAVSTGVRARGDGSTRGSPETLPS